VVAVLDAGLALVDAEEVGLGHLGVVRQQPSKRASSRTTSSAMIAATE
jgi:hypothetical protein